MRGYLLVSIRSCIVENYENIGWQSEVQIEEIEYQSHFDTGKRFDLQGRLDLLSTDTLAATE